MVPNVVGYLNSAILGRLKNIQVPFQFTCRNRGGGDRGRVAIYRPFGEFRRAKIVRSPAWCSRPTTGVPLAHATMNFVGLDLTTSDSSPPGDATAYQLLHRSINRQVASVVAKNDANLALSPTFRYVSIESSL
ncbi:hypothetical protein TNCV_4708591 [Trichonephila clavipes]|nr:hypothetical protein TNCV_4708591 [Trichonephila clavipes]